MGVAHVSSCGGTVWARGSNSGYNDEQMRNVGDAVHQVWCDAIKILVREVARREDVHREHGLLMSGWRYVDYASSLFTLQVCDKARSQVGRLLKNVHMIATTRQR